MIPINPEKKTVLVTGGSKGIGLAIAEKFAKEGLNVIISARDKKLLKEVAVRLIDEYSVPVIHFKCDVTSQPDIQTMISEIYKQCSIDILINNAGIHETRSFMDYNFDDFKHVVETNLYSVFHVSKLVVHMMAKGKGGRIINIASTAGKWGSKNQSAYNASKHAVIGLTRCMALELASYKINVNAICPWVVDTDMGSRLLNDHAILKRDSVENLLENLKASNPLGKLVSPDEVASLAFYLSTDLASAITGQSWTVDGGYTMI